MSEEEEDEEEEEESEEELLALRRDGWVCCSDVGFSAGENKHTVMLMWCIFSTNCDLHRTQTSMT